MKSDVIEVSNQQAQTDIALRQVEKVVAYKELSKKSALHLRLLAEEMMGMVRSITGETRGTFWIEDEDGVYQLHLVVNTPMTSGKREKLLSAASSGKNESAKGLMGRLRDLFDRNADADIAAYTNPLFTHEMMESTSSLSMDWEWSMLRYEDALAQRVKKQEKDAMEAWDELEKSVVAHVADDVKVSIKGPRVEMTIFKKMAD